MEIDLNGTWKGYIHSTWVHPKTGKRLDPILALLTVFQDGEGVVCTMRTAEMTSYSFREVLEVNPKTRELILNYQYTSYPLAVVSERSSEHKGTIEFKLVAGKRRRLKGAYYTSRNTQGDIDLEYFSTDYLSDFPIDGGDHPAQVHDQSETGLQPLSSKKFSIEKVDDLLGKNMIVESFLILEECAKEAGCDRIVQELVVVKCQNSRLDSKYRQQTIDWQFYNEGKNKVVHSLTALSRHFKESMAS